MKRYLEQIQDDQLYPTLNQRITMGMKNLAPRWLFRNFGQFFTVQPADTDNHQQSANPGYDPLRPNRKIVKYNDEFALGLPDKGFQFNITRGRFERIWSAKGDQHGGLDTITESYQKRDNGWFQVMETDERIFYEDRVNG